MFHFEKRIAYIENITPWREVMNFNFCSSGKNSISRVRFARSSDIVFATRS